MSPRVRDLLDPLPLLEVFLIGNIAFLAADITLAHAVNEFEHRSEWVPIVFSLAATPVLLLAAVLGGLAPTPRAIEAGGPGRGRRAAARWLGLLVGWGSVVIGIVGLLLHLRSQFFELRTLASLVYTAPFAAPLAYTGVGMLLILDRTVDSRSAEWARWVILLAAGGFVGNFILSVCDHAQNGFFRPAEWVAVVAGAAGVGMLAAVVFVPDNRPLIRLAWGVMVLQVAVGLLGFGLHVAANLHRPVTSLWQQFVYGAPAFAPLLFANIAILACMGLWALERTILTEEPRRVRMAVAPRVSES